MGGRSQQKTFVFEAQSKLICKSHIRKKNPASNMIQPVRQATRAMEVSIPCVTTRLCEKAFWVHDNLKDKTHLKKMVRTTNTSFSY